MSDDPPQESSQELRKTERYYVNKRVDSIETTMSAGFQDIHESIKNLHEAIKDSNAQTMNMFKECQKNCKNEVAAVKVDVQSLTGYKNRAIGAVGIILILLSIWRVA